MSRHWTPTELERLFDLRDGRGMEWEYIEAQMGRTAHACRIKYDRTRAKQREEGQRGSHPSLPIVADDLAIGHNSDDVPLTYLEQWQMDTERPTYQEILEHAQQGASLQRRLRPIRTRATRVIHTDQDNIFVVFLADFHLGAPGTDIRAFLETTDLLLSDPRFYFVVVGPDLETAFAWFYSAEAILNQVISPTMQIEAYHQWLTRMLPRCLGTCGDNHTNKRLLRVLGDLGIMWRDDIPYFHGHGLIDVELHHTATGAVTTYEILAKHQHGGRSIYHNLQPALRTMRDIYPLADVYCTAHTHQPGYLNNVFFQEARPAKPRQHFIVTGTFKLEDLHALYEYGGQGCLGVPTLWLDARGYGVVYYDSPEMALRVSG